MIIRINDKSGNNIAECDLYRQDIGIWYTNDKSNIINIFGDIIQTENGFVDALDIDIDNIYSSKKIDLIKSLASAWTTFEVLRTEYNLDISSDFKYIVDILHKPLLFGFITEKEYTSYINKVKDFLEYEDGMYNNSEYTYKELDNFIYKLNPIYEIW